MTHYKPFNAGKVDRRELRRGEVGDREGEVRAGRKGWEMNNLNNLPTSPRLLPIEQQICGGIGRRSRTQEDRRGERGKAGLVECVALTPVCAPLRQGGTTDG